MTIKSSISSEYVVKFLNELLGLDAVAINALFSLRMSCNRELRNYPTVQVGLLGPTHAVVGMLGILNGMFGADINQWGHITAVYEFGRIQRFKLTTEEDTTGFTKKRKEDEVNKV